MGIGTFGAFTQARLAIYAAQTGISVTGNNISNINTTGYTRQRLNQVSLYTAGSDRYYAEGDIRTGQGALVKNISQIRSPYLDIRFRELNAQVGFYDGRLEGLDSIARVLDEVGTGDSGKGEGGYGVLGLDIMKLYTALGNITDQTGHQEYDDTVKGVASSLVSRLRSYANRLESMKSEYDIMLHENLDQVNSILTNIRTLNEEIRKSEIHGDPALELRDARNNAIDELSNLIDIDVTYSEEVISAGLTVEKLTIRLGNANPDGGVETDESLLVDGVYSAKLSFKTPELNQDYIDGLKSLDEKLAAGDITKEDYDAAVQLLPGPFKKADGTATDDIREAKMLATDGENGNYLVTVSSLKNKRGELHYTTQKSPAERVEGTDAIQVAGTDGSGKPIPANTKVADLFKGNNKSVSVTQEDSPDKGDITIQVYTKGKDIHGNTIYSVQEFQQIVSRPVALDDNDLGGKLQAQREFLTEEGVFIDKNTISSLDENAAGKRGLQYYQKALDLLANQLANVLNDANQGFLRDPDGNYIKPMVDANGDKVLDEYGREKSEAITIAVNGADEKINKDWDVMEQGTRDALAAAVGLTDEAGMNAAGVSGKQVIDAYLKGQQYNAGTGKFEPENKEDTVDENGNTVKGWGESPHGAIFVGGPLFSNANNSNDTTDITAKNLNISAMWEHNALLVRNFTVVPGTTEVASGDSDNLRHLEYLVSNAEHDFTPNQLASSPNASDKVLFNGTFFDMWNDIGGTLGRDQTEASTNLDAYYQDALSVDTDRDSVSSVDFNDEAMNLMMYSKSYNAACRLMTTIDSVLDKLINNTGMTT